MPCHRPLDSSNHGRSLYLMRGGVNPKRWIPRGPISLSHIMLAFGVAHELLRWVHVLQTEDDLLPGGFELLTPLPKEPE